MKFNVTLRIDRNIFFRFPSSIQEKYYARQRAELAAPADASSASTAKELKPFDCYTEAEREEIVFWKRVLADWEKYRQRGGMNAAELDKRFLAYLALEYPDRKLSIATLYRKRKALAEGDLDGLVDGRGKGRKGKRSMPEPVWTFFRGALLQETKHMDIREAMRQTEEHFQLTDPDMLPLPSYSTFRRRVLEDIPPQLDFFDAVLPIDAEMYRNKKQKTTPESAKEALSALLPVLEAQTDWSRDAIFEACKQKAEAMEKKNGWLLFPLGIALSGKARTPGGGTDLAAMMGKEETLRRLNAAIEAL